MKIRSHLETLPPYIPIEPFDVLSARLGRVPSQIVKLDANENPYGPLPAVRGALEKLDFPHIYPDPESRALRAALSEFTGVPEEFLLAGAGADEMIDLLMRVFLEPGDSVLSCPPPANRLTSGRSGFLVMMLITPPMAFSPYSVVRGALTISTRSIISGVMFCTAAPPSVPVFRRTPSSSTSV